MEMDRGNSPPKGGGSRRGGTRDIIKGNKFNLRKNRPLRALKVGGGQQWEPMEGEEALRIRAKN